MPEYSSNKDDEKYEIKILEERKDSGKRELTFDESWNLPRGGAIASCAIVSKERIFFGSMDSYFYCLDRKTGKKL